jgi:hypothetical protein
MATVGCWVATMRLLLAGDEDHNVGIVFSSS